ncbi:hypothetical protein O3M35_005404 [Rhynocoris fuscipes]|uniref:Uncharacterized protein n=1 Tax=Rhynocoris fuscipes TaxID=488301 RepID=A0AAW1DJH8_9HEMI
MMRSIPGERQSMRISSHLTVIATWRTYSTPQNGSSRMTTTKPWRSPPSQYIRTGYLQEKFRDKFGERRYEVRGLRFAPRGTMPQATFGFFDRLGRGCFPPGTVGRGDPDRLTGDSRPPHIFVSLLFRTGGVDLSSTSLRLSYVGRFSCPSLKISDSAFSQPLAKTFLTTLWANK